MTKTAEIILNSYLDREIFEEGENLSDTDILKAMEEYAQSLPPGKYYREEEIDDLWERHSEHRRISIDDIIGLECMDLHQFKSAIKELTKING